MTARAPMGATKLGVIEGFYGTPWSHASRLEVLSTAARAGVGHYFWAPKNHPAHRERWSEIPSREHVAEMAELDAAARALGIHWVYGISPVLRLGRASIDARRVIDRLEPLRAAGLRAFLVAFDDTWPTLLPRFATREVGRAHGEVVRRVREELGARSPCELFTVPAIYYGRAPELPAAGLAYLRGLAETGGDVPAAWTGPRIFSRWVRSADRRALEDATGLSLWIWNNAIANDWLPLVTGAPLGLAGQERLSAAAPTNLDPELATDGALIALNGAREATLTRPSLIAMATWAAAPHRTDPRRALTEGLADCFGAEGAEVLGRLLGGAHRHALIAPWRRDLVALERAVASLDVMLSWGGRDAAELALADVRGELAALAALPGLVDATFAGSGVALDVAPTARKLAVLARAGLVALDALCAILRGERAPPLVEADRLLVDASKIRWDVDASAFVKLVEQARRAGRGRRRGRRSSLLP